MDKAITVSVVAFLLFAVAISSLYIDRRSLIEEVSTMRKEIEAMRRTIFELNRSRMTLSSSLEHAMSEVSRFRDMLNMYSAYAITANRTLGELASSGLRYCCIPESLPYVVNSYSVERTCRYLDNIGVDPSDPWLSIYVIYRWVSTSVRREKPDIRVHVPELTGCVETVNGSRLCYYRVRQQRFMREPHHIASSGYGDEADQAVLLYSLVTCFAKRIRAVADTWIGLAKLDTTEIVFTVASVNSEYTVLDPYRGYISREPGDLAHTIRVYLAALNIPADTVKLYKVDPGTGTYTEKTMGFSGG